MDIQPVASVLVVDDDVRIAAAIRRALQYERFAVEVQHDGQAALTSARRGGLDLVILDVMMPAPDGMEVCRRLRSEGNDVPILMLTARSEVPDRVFGLEAGADDYLVKPFAYEELVARVKVLLRRRSSSDAGMVRFADLTVEIDAMEVRRGDRMLDLTVLEFNLLVYFMQNPRIVLSRSQILEAVWGLDAETTSNIVDVYVRYLRNKLEAEDQPRLLHTVRGAGYVLRAV